MSDPQAHRTGLSSANTADCLKRASRELGKIEISSPASIASRFSGFRHAARERGRGGGGGARPGAFAAKGAQAPLLLPCGPCARTARSVLSGIRAGLAPSRTRRAAPAVFLADSTVGRDRCAPSDAPDFPQRIPLTALGGLSLPAGFDAQSQTHRAFLSSPISSPIC